MSAVNAEPQVFTLRNRNGLEVAITNYGGTVMSLRVPDRFGRNADVVLGFDTAEEYRGRHPYFGALIGRFTNRIAKGRFSLDGHAYVLATNDGVNHLHGGASGFDRALWRVEPRQTAEGSALSLEHISADGDEAYPGALTANVVYTLTESNELRLDYTAVTDRPTVVNLTQHSYFNLAGHGHGDVLGHEVFIDADSFTPTDAGLIPTGEIRSVAGTPFDFREPATIGARINTHDPQLGFGHGYDHNFVLKPAQGRLRVAARVHHQASGRVLEVLTTEPGLQFYTGSRLDGSVKGKGGARYYRHAGLCLEAQHYPDSPNQPSFPSARLDRGERFESTTVFRFSVVA